MKSELSLFATTFIISALMTNGKKMMWINPTPQSIRFCRPLRIALEKETNDNINIEKMRLETEVEEMVSHSFDLPNGKNISVDFDPYFTLIDGKCLNVIHENGVTTKCPVCFVTMDRFNQPDDWNSQIPEYNLTH